MTRCPACGNEIAETANDGNGHVLPRPRYVRLTQDARLVVACPHCRAELEILAPAMRLRVYPAEESMPRSLPQSGKGPPAG